jgi:hypothetical protein
MYQAKNKIPLFVLISFILFACSQPAQDPKTVADRYWQNLQVGNTVEAEKLVSLNSRYTFSESKDRTAAITKVSNSDAVTTVNTTITMIGPDNKTHSQSFDTVLVLENGQWKVDVNRSQIPPAPATDELTESMQESIESIDETMTQGMQMLNDALREGSIEMGDSLMHLLNELNSSMQESIDKLKQRRQQQELEQQNNKPDPDSGEGLI